MNLPEDDVSQIVEVIHALQDLFLLFTDWNFLKNFYLENIEKSIDMASSGKVESILLN